MPASGDASPVILEETKCVPLSHFKGSRVPETPLSFAAKGQGEGSFPSLFTPDRASSVDQDP